MSVPNRIADAVRTYHDSYRHSSLPSPQISGLYALFPKELEGADPKLSWPAAWPQGEKPGVYLIFGSEKQLLYVGKADCLAPRLNKWFQYAQGPDRGCHVIDPNWSVRPMFVATVAVSESFEASSLEQFLIRDLRPIDNKLGLKG